MIERDEYFESPRVKSRIRSGVDEEGKEYQRFEIIETTGDPKGPHGQIWTYIDKNGKEYSRIRQYNSDESLSFASDQIDGRDVDPSELDRYFTPNFATRGDPPGPGEVAAALERLRRKICGEEEEVKCTEIASISVSPASKQLSIGESYQLTATAKNCLLEIIENPVIAWLSSDYSVASVNTSGLVIGVSEGTATITATADGKSGSATIEVVTPPTPPPAPPEDYPPIGTWSGPLVRCFTETAKGSGFINIVVTQSPDPQWYAVFSCNGRWDWAVGDISCHLEFQGTGVVGKLAGGKWALIIDCNDYPGTGVTIGEGNFTYTSNGRRSTGTINLSAHMEDDGYFKGQVWPYGDMNGYCFSAFGD